MKPEEVLITPLPEGVKMGKIKRSFEFLDKRRQLKKFLKSQENQFLKVVSSEKGVDESKENVEQR